MNKIEDALKSITPEFMDKYTPFKTLGELLLAAGMTDEYSSNFELLERDALDKFIKEETVFDDFTNLKRCAHREFTKDR